MHSPEYFSGYVAGYAAGHADRNEPSETAIDMAVFRTLEIMGGGLAEGAARLLLGIECGRAKPGPVRGSFVSSGFTIRPVHGGWAVEGRTSIHMATEGHSLQAAILAAIADDAMAGFQLAQWEVLSA